MNHNETVQLESIDTILQNLRKDKNFYSHGTTYEQYMNDRQRD